MIDCRDRIEVVDDKILNYGTEDTPHTPISIDTRRYPQQLQEAGKRDQAGKSA